MLTNAKKWIMLGLYPVGMFILPLIIMLVMALFDAIFLEGMALEGMLAGELDFGIMTIATVISYGILCLVLVIISFGIFKQDFRKIKSWGNFTKQMAIGLIATFSAAFVGVTLVSLLGETDTALNQLIVEQALQAMPFLMIMTVIFFGPIVEEIIFRLVMMNLFPKIKPIYNVIFSSLIFGAMHVLAGGWIHIIPYFLMGIVFGYIYIRNDNIWHATVLHILHNGLTVGLIFLTQVLLGTYPY